jgi:hypothetical protein
MMSIPAISSSDFQAAHVGCERYFQKPMEKVRGKIKSAMSGYRKHASFLGRMSDRSETH